MLDKQLIQGASPSRWATLGEEMIGGDAPCRSMLLDHSPGAACRAEAQPP